MGGQHSRAPFQIKKGNLKKGHTPEKTADREVQPSCGYSMQALRICHELLKALVLGETRGEKDRRNPKQKQHKIRPERKTYN
jgi:hypothetical protein